jgi:adenylosuccinate lyase
VEKELPFMATENILMESVKKGGDRQLLHERIRIHSMEAGKRIKEEGLDNDLISRIMNDKAFNLSEDEIKAAINPEKFTGRASSQVTEFVSDIVDPILQENKRFLGIDSVITV